ncbi:MAG: DUF362 domain-containing protein [Acidobacteriaceae bacterium]|jgi:uncharacterized protein (DUF362 family)
MASDNPASNGNMTRREAMLQLLRLTGAGAGTAAAAVWLSGRSAPPLSTVAANVHRDHTVASDAALPEMVVVQGDDPRALVGRAFADLGGVGRFIAQHDVVVLKPNIAWDRTPEQAANTNPDVVAETVKQCWAAGAKRVIVTDVSCNEAERCFHRSGIAAAARAEGAEVILPDPARFREVNLGGEILQSWKVFEPFLIADKVINLPIAKHHDLTGATLGFKNWYGILGGERNRLHQQIHQSLVDLAAFMLPTLTLIDCYRVLLRNGPTGGNVEDVALHKTLVAGTDPVALDAYVAKAYWNLDADALPYLKLAEKRGLGRVDFEHVRTRFSQVG